MAGAMPIKRPLLVPLLLPGIATLVMGCGGYTSEYVPPPDGRPRLVWSDDKPVPMISNPVPQACSDAVQGTLLGTGAVPVGGVHVGGGHVSGGYYHPVRVVGVVHVGGPSYVPIPKPIVAPHFGGGSSGGGGFKLGGGGGGGGGDLGKGAIVLVVVAIRSLPFIARGLAAGRPEPEGEVAAAIDNVHAQTDLARTEGSPCDEMVVAGEVAQ
jgi:hypothetical protein